MDHAGNYLGQFVGIGNGPERGLGFVPIYVFENGIINDSYPAPLVIPTPCVKGGKRKATRKSRRNKRRNNKRNNSRRV
jgi:hypothetical protein